MADHPWSPKELGFPNGPCTRNESTANYIFSSLKHACTIHQTDKEILKSKTYANPDVRVQTKSSSIFPIFPTMMSLWCNKSIPDEHHRHGFCTATIPKAHISTESVAGKFHWFIIVVPNDIHYSYAKMYHWQRFAQMHGYPGQYLRVRQEEGKEFLIASLCWIS